MWTCGNCFCLLAKTRFLVHTWYVHGSPHIDVGVFGCNSKLQRTQHNHTRKRKIYQRIIFGNIRRRCNTAYQVRVSSAPAGSCLGMRSAAAG